MRGIRERVGKMRPDIPWTESRLDSGLAALVQNYPKENRPKVYELMEKYPEKQTLIFKTRAQAETWLDSLPGRPCDHRSQTAAPAAQCRAGSAGEDDGR